MRTGIDSTPVRSIVGQVYRPGYILIEAPSEKDIQDLCTGIPNIFWRHVHAVNINDAPRYLKVPIFQPRYWARLTQYPYHGDLAYVNYDPLSPDGIELLVIPRLPMDRTKHKRRGPRPAQGLFNANMMRQIWGNSSVEKRDQTYAFQDQEFKDGHLSIDGNGVNIYTEEAIPTAEEIALFKNNPSVRGSAVEEAVRRMSMRRLRERDWVKVTVGEYQGLVGIAKNISTDEAIIFVPEQHVEVTVALNQLRKYTKVGDEVKVIFGPHTGAEGWVVAVDPADNVAVLDPKTGLEVNHYLTQIILN